MRFEMLSTIAENEMLQNLWMTCFEDTEQAAQTVLRFWEKEQVCAAAIEEDHICAALYLLPCSFWMDGHCFPAHYLYGAGTFPQYRGKGIMRRLLQFAAETTAAKGDYCSILLPASRTLYQYYRGAGYQEYFYTRVVAVRREKLEALAQAGEQREALSWKEMELLRRQALQNQSGAALMWDARGIQFACLMNGIYEGNMVTDREGYAIYRPLGHQAEVLEWISAPQENDRLLSCLLQSTAAEEFLFRLPVETPFLSSRGDVIPFGMIKPLQKGFVLQEKQVKKPYLGLTLD